MSKGLENLSKLCEYVNYCDEANDCVDILGKELQRLEAIDQVESSEALECLEYLIKECVGNDKYVFEPQLNTIKQALLKAQEHEKVLSIIKEKRVCLHTLKDFFRRCVKDEFVLQGYNGYVRVDRELTKEEFDLLKRYLCQNE